LHYGEEEVEFKTEQKMRGREVLFSLFKAATELNEALQKSLYKKERISLQDEAEKRKRHKTVSSQGI